MPSGMKAQPFDRLLRSVLAEHRHNRSIFGIPQSLFYVPKRKCACATEDFLGQPLSTPIGPAAGPHTQLAQNIVCAWLSGGRFIELKTVQIMDTLEIPRPCIDMEDEGYNVEWSQELKLDESLLEYVKAWALIHILYRLLGFERKAPLGTVFNMSVGYNLEGITSPPMTRFMDRLVDASEELFEIRDVLAAEFRALADIDIPSRLANSVTLSTMHGCPPDEVERIARYLLEERGLHTTVKLNPTLLGKDAVMRILHDDLGFREIAIPDEVFAHDLEYGRAVELIRTLKKTAAARGLVFAVKLSNTLAMSNHKGTLPGSEMYMSGRALYPITMALFSKLMHEFDGDLAVSYSAGADALNVTTILACGARPVTAASDLLKPGGYSRLLQYLENLEEGMLACGARNLDELAEDRLLALERAADEARTDPRYKKDYHPHALPKVASALERFDCVAAPCVEACAVCQDVPEYAWLVGQGRFDRALGVILSRNPLPGVTSHVCTHRCETRCTRNNYDESVGIRSLKRFAFEHGKAPLPKAVSCGRRVAVIGAGPSGLAAAAFLAQNGLEVTVYEAKGTAGGMPALAPAFRLPRDAVEMDVERVRRMGVRIELGRRVVARPGKLLEEGFDAIYLACGFSRDAPLAIEGIEGKGVYGALDLLDRVARGEKPALGTSALVIGGGNTAMDAARTAQRLSGNPVSVVYRRTRAQMPAEEEELRDLLGEGNRLLELVSPKRVIREDGRLVALECVRNELGAPDADGRRKPLPVEGSEFLIPADSLIVAIGQAPDLTFLDGSSVVLGKRGTIAAGPDTGRAGDSVYAGGDAVRGPAIIIEACADGRRAAEAICEQLGIPFAPPRSSPSRLSDAEVLRVKRARARRTPRHRPDTLPVAERRGFDLVEQGLTETAARDEASRCLQCSTFCDKCVEVCPNRANVPYRIEPARFALPVVSFSHGELIVVGEEPFEVRQTRQIVHVHDFCNECGNCATFCVHQGKPFLEKPRLFLEKADFDKEEDNAFCVRQGSIYRRERGEESRLSLKRGGMTFENEHVSLRLGPDFALREGVAKQPSVATFSLKEAAEMAVLLRGLTRSARFLLV